MGALLIIAAWGLLAGALALLATRVLLALGYRRGRDWSGRAVFLATLFATIVTDICLFQGDLLRREQWIPDGGKGQYLWYMFPVASVFFLFVSGITSLCVRACTRERIPPSG